MDKEEQLTHESTGWECLVAHCDEPGQCLKCKHCHQWIRPSKMNDICAARSEKPTTEGKYPPGFEPTPTGVIKVRISGREKK